MSLQDVKNMFNFQQKHTSWPEISSIDWHRPMSPEWKSASTKWVETTKTGPAATNIESIFVFVKNVKNTKSEGEWDEVRIIVDSIFG